MLSADSVLDAPSLDAARKVIAAGFNEDSDIKDKYDWSHDAVYRNTGQFVAEFLGANPPNFRYPYNQITENLRIAGSHLEQCLNRQDAIFQLETSCISAVIDALNSDRIFEIDRSLETNRALADADAAGVAGASDVKPRVDEKFAIRRQVFDFQQRLFRAKGSALNFNERITFLRRLQADSLRSIYERLETARIGLAMAGIVKMPKVPVWDAANPAILLDLVLWMRRALRSMDLHATSEYPVTISIDTQRDAEFFFLAQTGAKLTSDQITTYLQSGGFDSFLFEFSDNVMKKRMAWGGTKSFRLAAFSIGIVFGADFTAILDTADKEIRDQLSTYAALLRSWRSTLRLGARIIPPQQSAQFDGGERIDWKPNEILLDELVPVTESVDAGALATIPTAICANLNPVGRWSISINDRMTAAGKETGLSYRPSATSLSWSMVKGIVITMTVMLKR